MPWVFVALFAVALLTIWIILKSRNLHIWILPWVVQYFSKAIAPNPNEDIQVYFCFVDHYEPYEGGKDSEDAANRVKRWLDEYPKLAKAHTDSVGNHPQHSFFYPEEEYDPELLEMLSQVCRQKVGDVEVHLHHDNDTAENLAELLNGYKNTLFNDHGFLRKDPETGEITFAFIHGNWALDNSAAGGRHCGIDNEIEVLLKAGCYADMTMPSAPSETQAKIINSICAIKGAPGQRKAFDKGRKLSVGDELLPGELLMVQGPLTLNWQNRKFGLIPKIESAEISYDCPPSKERVRLWEESRVCLPGAENHLFIKVHSHGAQKSAMKMLFDEDGFNRLWSALEDSFRDRKGYQLHYVTARELVEKINELMSGNKLTQLKS